MRFGEREQEIHGRLHGAAAGDATQLHLGHCCIVEAIRLEVREAPVRLADVGAFANAGAVGFHGILISPDSFEHVPEPEQGTDVPGLELQAFLVRRDCLIGERSGSKRRGAQEMHLVVSVIERERLVEEFQRLAVAILLLQQSGQVEYGQQVIRRQRNRFAQQAFRFGLVAGSCRDQRQQPQSIDVARILSKDAPVAVLGILEPPFLLMLRGQRHHAPLRRECETALECLVCRRATAQRGESPAEGEPGVLECRVEDRGLFE